MESFLTEYSGARIYQLEVKNMSLKQARKVLREIRPYVESVISFMRSNLEGVKRISGEKELNFVLCKIIVKYEIFKDYLTMELIKKEEENE